MTRSVLPIALALALTACSGPQSTFDAAGPASASLRTLIIVIVAICSLVWALVMIAMIWALMRRRSDDAPTAVTRDRKLTLFVAIAVGATVFIIAGFTIASFHATRAVSADNTADLVIRIRGEQWWWNVRYLDSDPARSFATANEIHIPVGQTVRLDLESGDVIHSFWVPSLAGKLDLIPGRINTLTLRADRAGVYRGQCAEFCGTQHSHMALLVIAQELDDFAAWQEAQRRRAVQPDGEAGAGAEVFISKPCAGCHTIRGTQAAGTTGPDLTHVAARRTIAAGLAETTRGAMAAWIVDPQRQKPGNSMPNVPLTADELQKLSAYMMSLK